MKASRKKAFDTKQREKVQSIQQKIDNQSDPTKKKDHEKELEALNSLTYVVCCSSNLHWGYVVRLKTDSLHQDVGPVYDVVVFKDEKDVWRVIVDVNETCESVANTLPTND